MVLTEATGGRRLAVAGGVAVDLEVGVVADMTVVLTEVGEVDPEEEEAWGKCVKNHSGLLEEEFYKSE